MPLPTGWKQVRIIDINSTTPPSPSPSNPRPFQTDPASGLLAVDFTVREMHSVPSFSHPFTLLIPHSKIRTLADRSPQGKTLEWTDWGQQGSVLVHCPDAHNAGVALRPFGSMYPLVCRDPAAPPPWPVALLDLNPFTAYRSTEAEGMGAAQEEDTGQGLRARVRAMLYNDPQDPHAYQEYFAAPVRTLLPYNVYRGPPVIAFGTRMTARIDVLDGGLVAVVSTMMVRETFKRRC